jgi:hypothetical protein
LKSVHFSKLINLKLVRFSNIVSYEICTLFKWGFMASGGARPGSGRKKGITTKPVRVPEDIHFFIHILSEGVRQKPEDFDHLFNPESALYMLACLSSSDPLRIANASARLGGKKKRKK